MLSGVLLHVIEPPAPINLSNDQGADPERLVGDMHDVAVVVIEHVGHLCAAKCAGVERLATRCRVERGSIENDTVLSLIRTACDHSGVERSSERVGVIQAVSHVPALMIGSSIPAS